MSKKTCGSCGSNSGHSRIIQNNGDCNYCNDAYENDQPNFRKPSSREVDENDREENYG